MNSPKWERFSFQELNFLTIPSSVLQLAVEALLWLTYGLLTFALHFQSLPEYHAQITQTNAIDTRLVHTKFDLYDVKETSYHFVCEKIDLHFCDDPGGEWIHLPGYWFLVNFLNAFLSSLKLDDLNIQIWRMVGHCSYHWVKWVRMLLTEWWPPFWFNWRSPTLSVNRSCSTFIRITWP